MAIAVLGGGITGCGVALELANRGEQVVLFERRSKVLQEASRWNEGKLHLGLVYAADHSGKTINQMLAGSIKFLPILSRWIDLDALGDILSEPFDYCVPRDSLLTIDHIENHFLEVEKQLHMHLENGNGYYPGHRHGRVFTRVDVDKSLYDHHKIAAQFRTVERAIDVEKISRALSQAVAGHPRIESRPGTFVQCVRQQRCSSYCIETGESDSKADGPFTHVVNALWSNRLVMDQRFGLDSHRPWMNRFKLGVHLEAGDAAPPLPTVTFALGSYGDIVRFPNGRIYFSWYPAGMVGWNSTMENIDWQGVRRNIDEKVITLDSISGLTRLMPQFESLLRPFHDQFHVEGGAIFAWGNSDIGSLASQLHERHAIGVHQHGNYLSIDTGKYTTAPKFALEVADMISPSHHL